MAQSKEQRAINKIIKETTQAMQSLGTYREEFADSIKKYAQLRYLYDLKYAQFVENGYQTTEEYTNNSGATNIRKTADYLALETLRKDLLGHESLLGLNPSGLKKIRADTQAKKNSKLEAALNES